MAEQKIGRTMAESTPSWDGDIVAPQDRRTLCIAFSMMWVIPILVVTDQK